MFGHFAYRLAKFLATGVLMVFAIAVLMDGLAWLAIEDDGAWNGHENAPGAAPQSALPADVSASGRSAAVGPYGTVVSSKEHGAATIRGHDAPIVTARLVRDGHSLVSIDASGHTRLSNVDAAWQIPSSSDGGSLGRVARKFWKAFGSPLARLSLAALAHVHEMSFRDCEDCPEMVVVPAGRFLMGSPEGEEGREAIEGLQHEVTLASPFAVGKYHVTRAQYARFIEVTGYQGDSGCLAESKAGAYDFWVRKDLSWRFPGYTQSDDHPAVCIGWDDAEAYARWLSLKTGHAYRLLTEAEWEYSARAGSISAYSFGNSSSEQCRYANGLDASAKQVYGEKKQNWRFAECDDGFVYTAPDGLFRPNRFGLYDMNGNAWTWVKDCYFDSYKDAPADGTPRLAEDCESRVLRGGSWLNSSRLIRSASRIHSSPGTRESIFGFRVARTLQPAPANPPPEHALATSACPHTASVDASILSGHYKDFGDRCEGIFQQQVPAFANPTQLALIGVHRHSPAFSPGSGKPLTVSFASNAKSGTALALRVLSSRPRHQYRMDATLRSGASFVWKRDIIDNPAIQLTPADAKALLCETSCDVANPKIFPVSIVETKAPPSQGITLWFRAAVDLKQLFITLRPVGDQAKTEFEESDILDGRLLPAGAAKDVFAILKNGAYTLNAIAVPQGAEPMNEVRAQIIVE